MITKFLLLWSLVNTGPASDDLYYTIKHNNVVNLDLTLLVIAIESSFKTDSTSHVGAVGLMQLTPIALMEVQAINERILDKTDNKQELTMYEREYLFDCQIVNAFNFSDLKDPKKNVLTGTCFLKHLMLQYDGDMWKVLTHYNGGGRAVEQLETGTPYEETKDYLFKYQYYKRKVNL